MRMHECTYAFFTMTLIVSFCDTRTTSDWLLGIKQHGVHNYVHNYVYKLKPKTTSGYFYLGM